MLKNPINPCIKIFSKNSGWVTFLLYWPLTLWKLSEKTIERSLRCLDRLTNKLTDEGDKYRPHLVNTGSKIFKFDSKKCYTLPSSDSLSEFWIQNYFPRPNAHVGPCFPILWGLILKITPDPLTINPTYLGLFWEWESWGGGLKNEPHPLKSSIMGSKFWNSYKI